MDGADDEKWSYGVQILYYWLRGWLCSGATESAAEISYV